MKQIDTSIHPFVHRAIQGVKLGRQKPLWYETITQHYPPLLFHKPQPVDGNKKTKDIKTTKKIQKISYPEDRIRIEFYKRFPMELTRPVDLNSKSISEAEQAIRYQIHLLNQGHSYDTAKELAIEKYLYLAHERDKKL